MNFIPTLEFPGGRVRALTPDDRDALFRVYQQPELPGQPPLQQPDQLDRMIELSLQMAATQRGMMWALELGSDADGYQVLGQVSAFDWQPSLLRTTLRVDGLPELEMAQRGEALRVCTDFMASKYHLRNFAYQWVDGQDRAICKMLEDCGFEHCATLRDGWRTGEQEWRNVAQYHRVLVSESNDEAAS